MSTLKPQKSILEGWLCTHVRNCIFMALISFFLACSLGGKTKPDHSTIFIIIIVAIVTKCHSHLIS